MGLLEAGGIAAFFRHRLHDGTDDAVEESIGKIGQERIRGIFFQLRAFQGPDHLRDGRLPAFRPEQHRAAVHLFDRFHGMSLPSMMRNSRWKL